MTTNAINDFLATGVDLVHVMLGANDVIYGVDTNQYKDNLQNLINQIKNAGIKHVILSCPTYSTTRDSVQLATHCDKIKELVAENSGYVLLGDTQAYDYFKNNISDIADGVHLTTAGYNKLGEFRADAIKSAIEYQINPVHQRSGSSSHQLTTS
ncbi:MAG: GDSL-type esterase/lipase family protein [Candidatus Peribacteria bacterium]|jgi:lysophospholipase L1-like esterase|nr:GDSL-type esterase/lipase family protein [Candidatus Peribacteria bacterium]